MNDTMMSTISLIPGSLVLAKSEVMDPRSNTGLDSVIGTTSSLFNFSTMVSRSLFVKDSVARAETRSSNPEE